MPATYRSASSDQRSQGTQTVANRPSGVVSGDLLIAIAGSDRAGTLAAMTAPSGWTLLDSGSQTSAGFVKVWTKIAGGSEPSTYTFPDHASADSTLIIVAVQAGTFDPAAPIAAYAFGGSNTAATGHVAPSVTGVADGLLVCGWFGGSGSNGTRTYTPPSGMTERAECSANLWVVSSAATLALSAAGATGTKSATCSASVAWIAVSIVVAPLATAQQVTATGIASGEAWGAPVVAPGPAPVGPTSIDSGEVWGAHTVAPGPVTVGAGGIASAEAWGVPAVQMTVAPDGVASAEAWGVPTVNVGPTIAPAGIASAEAWGAPVVVPGPVTTTPGGIGSGEVWGAPAVVPLIRPDPISSAEAWGVPTVLVGAVAVYPGGMPSAEAWGAPVVVPGPVTAAPGGIASGEAWGQPALRLHVVPSGIGSAEAWGAPVVVVGAVTIFPPGIVSGEAWGVPALSVTIDPTVTRGIVATRIGARYELVCVARLPSATGPPAFEEVERVALRSVTWSSELSAAQTLSATCAIRSLPEPVLQRLRTPDRLATEFWLNRDGRRVFAGPFVTMRPEGGGEFLTINALGILAYTQLMFLTSDMVFAQVDQHHIGKALVDHWQEHPTIRHGHYGIDTSAVGPSGVLRDRTYVAVEGHQVSRRLQELGAVEGGFDADVDPTTRRLELWTPQKGVDRSTGSDAIVLDRRNITDPNLLVSVAPGDLASVAIGTSTAAGADTALWSMAINPELAAAYGAAGVMASWSDISQQPTLDGYVNALLAARATTLVAPGPRTRVTADADISAYDVGDTVAFDDFVLGLSGAWRIRKRTVDVAESGEETASLEFV